MKLFSRLFILIMFLSQVGCNNNKGSEPTFDSNLNSSAAPPKNDSSTRLTNVRQKPAIGFLDSITTTYANDGRVFINISGWATSFDTNNPVEISVTFYSESGYRIDSGWNGGIAHRFTADKKTRSDVASFLKQEFKLQRGRTQFDVDFVPSEIFGSKACFEIYTANPYSRTALDVGSVGGNEGCITFESMASDLKINKLISTNRPELVASWGEAYMKHIVIEASICISDVTESNALETIASITRAGSNLSREVPPTTIKSRAPCESDPRKTKFSFDYHAYVYLGFINKRNSFEGFENGITLQLNYKGIPESNTFRVGL